jgi:hypothetical protein
MSIIGIGAGSTNARPLITVRSQELDRLDSSTLLVQEVGGGKKVLDYRSCKTYKEPS